MLDLRDRSSVTEFRFPTDNSDYLPLFAIGDFDGNGRNDLAVAELARQQVRIFRMPSTEPGHIGSVTHLQTRHSGERTQLLQALSRAEWSTHTPSPPELLALDWVGTDMQLLELSIDPSVLHPLRVESAPGIAIAERSSVIGLAEGRYFKGEPLPSVAVMTQEGRTVTLELFKRDRNGTLEESGIVVDRWRTEPDDRPLRNSLAAVDLDGDGIDELANGRSAGPDQGRQELHFHSLALSPRPAASLVRIEREIVPRGAELTAITRLPGSDRESRNLALAYRVGERDTVVFLDVRADVPVRLVRETSWVSETGRLSGLAALPVDDNEPLFALVERGHEGQNLVRIVAMPGSQLEPTQPFTWPNLRDRGVWVTAVVR
jgi:hypothetical protein